MGKNHLALLIFNGPRFLFSLFFFLSLNSFGQSGLDSVLGKLDPQRYASIVSAKTSKKNLTNRDGSIAEGTSVELFLKSLNNRLGDVNNIIENVSTSKKKTRIIQIDENYSPNGIFKPRKKSIYLDPDATHSVTELKMKSWSDGRTEEIFYPIGKLSPATILLHEVAHAWNWISDKKAYKKRIRTYVKYYDNAEEEKVIRDVEWPAAKARKEPIRNNHR